MTSGYSKTFGGFRLLEIEPQCLLNAIEETIARRGKMSLLYLNPHIYNLAQENERLRAAICRADWVLVDGIGIVLISRWSKCRIQKRLTLMDYVYPLLDRARNHEWSIYFLGGEPEITTRLRQSLLEQIPGLNVAGCRHGYFSEHEEEELVAEINRARPQIVMVGMGTPRQELWIDKYLSALETSVVIAAGGSFSNLGGIAPRAPAWMHRNGLEWLFRLSREPKRLIPRYVLGTLLFLYYCLCQSDSQKAQ
jgi:N-acetylglucosaminyldiphosphoundecaprenol N-acetyl-beta-D-mannosaminyltransferase